MRKKIVFIFLVKRVICLLVYPNNVAISQWIVTKFGTKVLVYPTIMHEQRKTRTGGQEGIRSYF